MINPIRQFIKGCTSKGLRNALRNVKGEFQIYRIHRGGVRKAAACRGEKNLKLNIGCGPNIKPGWVNIDLGLKYGEKVVHLDLREPLPFDDGSAEVVYSEHFFEHLEYPAEVSHFLKESQRVLRPGGLFRAGMPDASPLVIAYAQQDAALFKRVREQHHPASCDTWMHQLNYLFRQGNEHKYAWDFETLAKVLLAAGWVDVVRTDFDPVYDSPERKGGTMYVNARNPATKPAALTS